MGRRMVGHKNAQMTQIEIEVHPPPFHFVSFAHLCGQEIPVDYRYLCICVVGAKFELQGEIAFSNARMNRQIEPMSEHTIPDVLGGW